MAVGIRVVTVSGAPILWREAALRFSVDIVLGFLQTSSSMVGLLRLPDPEYSSLSWSDRFQRLDQLSPYSGPLLWLSNVWVWSEIVVLLFNKRRRALHDFIAGTVVVHVTKSAAV
jgi:uncharacterized RDD family membrane protein YckC